MSVKRRFPPTGLYKRVGHEILFESIDLANLEKNYPDVDYHLKENILTKTNKQPSITPHGDMHA